jgi:hypothetical protein
MIAKHVDDLKVAGRKSEVALLIAELEAVFGKLTITTGSFTNCGVRHIRHPDGSISMDQDEYIAALIPVTDPELVGKAPEASLSGTLESKYRSLLGAIAYTQLTQHQIACYIVALQRSGKQPTAGDLRRLNVLTKRLQSKPITLWYSPLPRGGKLVSAFGDAGFKKEEVDGYALRGSAYLRHSERMFDDAGKPNTDKVPVHLITAEAKSIKTVVRSTYAAELLSATATADTLIPLSVTLHEIECGPVGTTQLKHIRENGWEGKAVFETSLFLDAKSVYASLDASTFKPPVEHSLAGHVLWLREMNSLGLINNIIWCDTRDMLADGLNKGSVPRQALVEAMTGSVKIEHEVAIIDTRTLTRVDNRLFD